MTELQWSHQRASWSILAKESLDPFFHPPYHSMCERLWYDSYNYNNVVLLGQNEVALHIIDDRLTDVWRVQSMYVCHIATTCITCAFKLICINQCLCLMHLCCNAEWDRSMVRMFGQQHHLRAPCIGSFSISQVCLSITCCDHQLE